MRKIAFIAAALGLAAAPLAAQTAVRDAAPVEGESEIAGQGLFFAAVGIAAVVATVILVTENDSDVDLPVSA